MRSMAPRRLRYAWKTSSIRGQTIRLVQDAVRMMRGGYRELLRGD